MYRYALLFALACVLCLPAFGATTKVILNGNVVTLPVMDVDGKAFVDVVALMKLLGGKCTYDAANAKLFINAAGGGGGGTTATGGGGGSTGTAQLAGDNGQLAQVYSLDKLSPIFFRLVSAEFTVAQVVIGSELYAPLPGEKLLLLHFTVQNPDKAIGRLARNDVLRITAFDAMNNPHVCDSSWGDEGNHQIVGVQLKPAQTLACYCVLRVQAKGPIPKLMIQPSRDNNGPVLRYMFTDQIKALDAPFADPADASGYTALDTIPAAIGTPYPFAKYTVTLEKFDFSTDPLGGANPPAGGRFLTATILVHNSSPDNVGLRDDHFLATLTDADGIQMNWGGLVAASSGTVVDQGLKTGAEMRVRLYFSVPKGSEPKTLVLQEGRFTHSYQFDVK